MEEAGEEWLEKRSEDDLGATREGLAEALSAFLQYCLPSLRKSHPEDQDKLEDVIEWEPIDSIDSRLNHGQEGIHNPILPRMSAYGAYHAS